MKPEALKVLVVGGVAAGPKFCMTLKRKMPQADITLFERGKSLSFGACVLPYVLSGAVPDIQTLTRNATGEIRNSEYFEKTGGIKTFTGMLVVKIARKEKFIIVQPTGWLPKPIKIEDIAKECSVFSDLSSMVSELILSQLEINDFINNNLPTEKIIATYNSKDGFAKTINSIINDALSLFMERIGRSSMIADFPRGYLEQIIKKIALMISTHLGLEFYDYDKLFLATGAEATIPPIKCRCSSGSVAKLLDFENVTLLQGLKDGQYISSGLRTGQFKNVAIIGAGLIGSEAASSIKEFDNNINVVMFERQPSILSELLDSELSSITIKFLQKQGILILTGTTIVDIVGENGRDHWIITNTGKKLQFDLIIICTGVKPNTKLAQESGLALGQCGGIEVNENMVTSDPDILAAGDCVEKFHMVSKKMVLAPLGDIANIQARVAADVLSGKKVEFKGIIGTCIAEVFIIKDHYGDIIGRFSVGCTGLNQRQAVECGFDIEAVLLPSKDKVSSMPDAEMIYMKVIADRKTRRIIGVQGVGLGDINRRIASAATAIRYNATVDEIATLDLPYAPPFSPAIDPFIMASWMLQNKFSHDYRGITESEIQRKIANGEVFELIDVREPVEFLQQSIAGSTLIPLSEISEKMKDAKRDAEYILTCLVGQRAYIGSKKLIEMGFSNVKVMEGGLLFWNGKISHNEQDSVAANYFISGDSEFMMVDSLEGDFEKYAHRNSQRIEFNTRCTLRFNPNKNIEGTVKNISLEGAYIFLGYLAHEVTIGDVGEILFESGINERLSYVMTVSHISLDGIGVSITGWSGFYRSTTRNKSIFPTSVDLLDKDHIAIWHYLQALRRRGLNLENHIKLLSSTFDIAHKHFFVEEKLINTFSISGLSNHRLDHENFLDQLQALEYVCKESWSIMNSDHVEIVKDNLLRFLGYWLVRHTNSLDQGMLAEMRKKGVDTNTLDRKYHEFSLSWESKQPSPNIARNFQ